MPTPISHSKNTRIEEYRPSIFQETHSITCIYKKNISSLFRVIERREEPSSLKLRIIRSISWNSNEQDLL